MSPRSKLRVAVCGANGRMGQAVIREIAGAHSDQFTLAAALGHHTSGALTVDAGANAGVQHMGVPITNQREAIQHADVAIDFSHPEGTVDFVRVCAQVRVPIVVGTTGLHTEALDAIARAAEQIPIVVAPNTSVGVAILLDLVGRAARALPDFDVEIVESHHRKKADAPSGTALALVEAIQRARADLKDVVHGRSGRPGPRPASEIGVHALRGGDVVGEHTVTLLGLGERIELTHRASDRGLFAKGALRAADWLRGRAPGRYTMVDVVG